MTPPPPARVRTQVSLPLRFSDGYTTTARAFTFDGLVDAGEHLALRLGERRLATQPPHGAAHGTGQGAGHGVGHHGATLVRVHSECLTGDVFGSGRCDCGPQLRESAERVAAAGGLLLYLRQEGRGIGLYAKLDAYALQDDGLDTYDANLALGFGADERDYTVAAQMLRALGIRRIALLTNNPDKVGQLERLGVDVAAGVPTGVHVSEANAAYLAAKVRRRQHTLELPAI